MRGTNRYRSGCFQRVPTHGMPRRRRANTATEIDSGHGDDVSVSARCRICYVFITSVFVNTNIVPVSNSEWMRYGRITASVLFANSVISKSNIFPPTPLPPVRRHRRSMAGTGPRRYLVHHLTVPSPTTGKKWFSNFSTPGPGLAVLVRNSSLRVTAERFCRRFASTVLVTCISRVSIPRRWPPRNGL